VTRPRVVFDCNVLIQAVAAPDGPSAAALRLYEQNLIEVFLSRAVLKELGQVLHYPIVRQKLPGLDDDRIDAFLHRLRFRATLLRGVRHVFDYPRAREDEPYIDLAAAAKADFLVSRDKDLLCLAGDHTLIAKQFRQKFPRVRVVNPVAFVAAVATT
jgi:putative PIN family toxin of toxin-antitoxin system